MDCEYYAWGPWEDCTASGCSAQVWRLGEVAGFGISLMNQFNDFCHKSSCSTSVADLYGILAFRHLGFPWEWRNTWGFVDLRLTGNNRLLILKMVSHQGHVVVALVCEREKLPFLADRSCMFVFFSSFFLENIGHLAEFHGFHGL